MALTGNHSSFIPCTFYRLLTERWGAQGEAAYQSAFYHYAMRKGIRCAQHVVHEGLPLTIRSYNMYREAEGATPERLAERRLAEERKEKYPASTKEYTDGQYVSKCYYCDTPVFIRACGLSPEYEHWNCTHIDRMMVHAYNPDIFYAVTETFVTSDHCEHHCREAAICPEDAAARRPEPAPPMGFIIWSEYVSMAEVVEGIFGAEGKRLAEDVRCLFVQRYGEEAWEEIQRFQGADLDVFYPACLGKEDNGV